MEFDLNHSSTCIIARRAGAGGSGCERSGHQMTRKTGMERSSRMNCFQSLRVVSALIGHKARLPRCRIHYQFMAALPYLRTHSMYWYKYKVRAQYVEHRYEDIVVGTRGCLPIRIARLFGSAKAYRLGADSPLLGLYAHCFELQEAARCIRHGGSLGGSNR